MENKADYTIYCSGRARKGDEIMMSCCKRMHIGPKSDIMEGLKIFGTYMRQWACVQGWRIITVKHEIIVDGVARMVESDFEPYRLYYSFRKPRRGELEGRK